MLGLITVVIATVTAADIGATITASAATLTIYQNVGTNASR